MKPKTIALLIVLVLFLIILLQNMAAVELNILIWPIRMPKLMLILSSVFMGWVVGWFTHLAFLKRRIDKKSEKQAAKAEKKEQAEKRQTHELEESESSAAPEKIN